MHKFYKAMGKLLTRGRKLVKKDPIGGALPKPASIDIPVRCASPTPMSPPAEQDDEPRTPKKRKIEVIDKKLLFTESPNAFSDDSGKDELLTPPTTPSVYTLAKSVFQRSSTSKIFGRQAERETIAKFIAPLVKKKRGHGALYLSGVPGTGKSALLAETLDKIARIEPHVHLASINCMIVDKPEIIYSRIYNALVEDNSRRTVAGTQYTRSLENEKQTDSSSIQKMIQRLDVLFQDEKACHIVVLDELDHVMTKDQEVLFRIFQWAFMDTSNLILIGIANALDLTDRFLPRLRANSLTPQVLPFSPYTASEIQTVLENKLRDLTGQSDGDLPLMQPSAISLIAKKVAAYTGDIRKAMDICRRAIEMVEEDYRRKSGSAQQLTFINAPRVSVVQVSRICSTAFGGSTVTRIRQLNLQQKAVLCVLVKAEREFAAANLTITRLYESYVKISQREKLLQKLSAHEFFEVVSVLEAAGVVSIAGVCGRKGMGSSGMRKRTSRGGSGASAGVSSVGSRDEYGNRRIVSSVHIMDLSTGIGDIPVLASYIQ